MAGTYTPSTAASARSTRWRLPAVRPEAVHDRTTSVISATTSSPSPMTKKSTYSASGSGLNAACPPAPMSGWCGPRSSLRTGTPARSMQLRTLV